MTEKEREKQAGEVSRREFLKDAGFLVGGAAVGAGIAYPLVAGKGDGEVVTTTKVNTVTNTVEVPGPTKTVTIEVPGGMSTVKLTVNGKPYELTIGDDINEWDTLLHTLRETLKLTGTKIGCDHGECGMCTVNIDGKAALACLTLTVECDGKEITTIEGLADSETGVLHPIQQAFVSNYGFQCGVCTPGFIMATKALLDKKPDPTEYEVRQALAGNICRCTGYRKIIESALAAATLVKKTANLQLFSSSTPFTPGEDAVEGLVNLFNANHTWIHAKWQYTPLPSSLQIIDNMPAARKKYSLAAFLPPTDFLLARAGGGPEKHSYSRAYTDLLFVANISRGGWTFLTKNAELAVNPKRLAGKVIGVVNAPEDALWGSPTLLSNAILRDAWGIIDEVEQVKVDLPDVAAMLNARQIDAAFWGMANNMSGTYTTPGPLTGALLSSPTYWIPLTQEDADKINAANVWKVNLMTLPRDSIKLAGPPLSWTNPTFDVTMCDWGGALAMWEDTEEDVVYEMLKFITNNAEKIQTAGLRLLPVPEKMAQWPGLTRDMVHPGALKFYEEHGVQVGE